jgi:MoaA/NifB/PqqE/SkfB family radical SAM enzyme
MNLNDNVYNQNLSRDQPKFKLWSSAGLLLTYKCSASCEFCYYNGSPHKNGLMSVDTAIAAWQSLKTLVGSLAKIHLTGGEPFLYFETLEQILLEAKRQNLGPADIIETNAFWATSEKIARERISRLKELGINKLKISCDPFHQEYVDIKFVRTLAQVAKEILGNDRVLVRWEKYLEAPLQDYFACLKDCPCRFTGRAADKLASMVADKPLDALKLQNCSADFLGAKSVHIDPYGNIFSGTCSGISLGNVTQTPLEKIWQDFQPSNNELINTLFTAGPYGLLKTATEVGYTPLPAYADKCHLCTHLRQFFSTKNRFPETIVPQDCYQ